jgi:hypothetical protein
MIKASKDTIDYLLKESYTKLVESNNNSDSKSLVAHHFGRVSQNLIHSMTEEIEDRLLERGEEKSTIRKVFAVFIEGLQNVYNHGASTKGEDKLGAFVLEKIGDHYVVHFMNLIDTSGVPKLQIYLDKLNNLNKEETKELYMETLSNGVLSEKGGAGLGYMTMRLKSLHLIEYGFTEPLANQCGFHFWVRIDQKK